MSYCPKCGNKIEETMVFCPQCGTSLKGEASSQTTPAPTNPNNEKSETTQKQDKKEHPEKSEKQVKNEHSFIAYLMGGLILITIGVFSILDLTSTALTSDQDLAVMLLIIGIIIIIGAVYVAYTALTAHKRGTATQQITNKDQSAKSNL